MNKLLAHGVIRASKKLSTKFLALRISPYSDNTGSNSFLSGGTVDIIIDFLIIEFTSS